MATPATGQSWASLAKKSSPPTAVAAPTVASVPAVSMPVEQPTSPQQKSTPVMDPAILSMSLEPLPLTAHDVLVSLLLAMRGELVHVWKNDGSVWDGVFSSPTAVPGVSHYSFHLKMAQQRGAEGVRNLNAFVNDMQFISSDVLRVCASTVGSRVDSIANSKFQTDSQISAASFQLVERTLQPWQASEGGAKVLHRGLDEEINRSGGARDWDQFAAQPHLKSTYNEEIYCPKIDQSDPDYKANLAKAELIARRIEASSSEHVHVLEERGRRSANQTQESEEDLFSTVLREANDPTAGSRYVIPSKRQQSGVVANPSADEPKSSGAGKSYASLVRTTGGTPAAPVPAAAPARSVIPNDRAASKSKKDKPISEESKRNEIETLKQFKQQMDETFAIKAAKAKAESDKVSPTQPSATQTTAVASPTVNTTAIAAATVSTSSAPTSTSSAPSSTTAAPAQSTSSAPAATASKPAETPAADGGEKKKLNINAPAFNPNAKPFEPKFGAAAAPPATFNRPPQHMSGPYPAPFGVPVEQQGMQPVFVDHFGNRIVAPPQPFQPQMMMMPGVMPGAPYMMPGQPFVVPHQMGYPAPMMMMPAAAAEMHNKKR